LSFMLWLLEKYLQKGRVELWGPQGGATETVKYIEELFPLHCLLLSPLGPSPSPPLCLPLVVNFQVDTIFWKSGAPPGVTF
jgi:hypothetical protein